MQQPTSRLTYVQPERLIIGIQLLPLHLPLIFADITGEFLQGVWMTRIGRWWKSIVVNDWTKIGDRIGWSNKVTSYRCNMQGPYRKEPSNRSNLEHGDDHPSSKCKVDRSAYPQEELSPDCVNRNRARYRMAVFHIACSDNI